MSGSAWRPSIPKFASERAAQCCELRNRDTNWVRNSLAPVNGAPVGLGGLLDEAPDAVLDGVEARLALPLEPPR
jgi:hypothetical protein